MAHSYTIATETTKHPVRRWPLLRGWGIGRGTEPPEMPSKEEPKQGAASKAKQEAKGDGKAKSSNRGMTTVQRAL